MKIILTTTTLVALLAIGILGINNSSSSSNNIGNAFAQMEPEDSPMAEMMEDETDNDNVQSIRAYGKLDWNN
jgi:hypothetical protein